MNGEDIIQGSPEWRAMRLGMLTASCAHEAFARTKSGWGASRDNLSAALIAERLTGVPRDTYTSPAMQWGTQTEAEGRAAYSFHADADVVEVAFVPHPHIAMVGCSPDGFVCDDGLLELKCPNTATHIDTLLGAPIAAKYITQMQFQMMCTGRKWCDWASYDPRMPEAMRLFVQRVNRDDAIIALLEKQTIEFLAELEAKMSALTERYQLAQAA